MRRSTVLTVLASGLLAAPERVAAQASAVTVRIGATAIEPSAEAYYGSQNGMFLAAGINPQLSTLANGANIIAAVAAGDLDVGMANPLQLAVAIARGIPLQMLAPGCIYSKNNADPNFVVAKTSPITAPKDLIGATLGVGSLQDFNQVSLLAWLDANKVPRASVHFIELPFSEIGPALVRGTIQAGFITEPAKTAALRAGQIRDFADTYVAIGPEIATVVWLCSKSWLQANPETARKLASAIYAVGRWANTHPQEAGVLLAAFTKVDPAVVAATRRRTFPTANDPRYVQETLRLAARYGMLPRPVTVEEYTAVLN